MWGEDFVRGAGPSSRRERLLPQWAVVGLAALLFAAIFALRAARPDPGEATLLLFVVPIALCAIEFGVWGGLVAGALGMALVIVWDAVHPMHYGVIGYAVRAISFFMLGGLLGRFVSARRRLERQIARFEELSVDLVATASFDGYFKRLNPAWERTLGYRNEELRSRPFVDFVHPDDRERTVAEAANLAERGTDTVSFRNRYRASDGSYRWLDWNARAVAEDDLIYATARDVTERKADDDAIRAARAEADQANRAKSEFLSRMSHELRTPLNAILGFGQLLEIEELDARERESVEQIMRAGRHLLELINEVLDISRIDAGTMSISLEAVDVVSAVSDAVSLVAPLARERRINLVADVALPAAPYVKADRQRLRQVLLNLLSNAVKYNREGGSVEISLRRSPERLRLAVKDTGIGISDARLGQLFEPFERLGAERGGVEGTGLGLALSQRLVEAMGGSISADSKAGKGTTFFVDLAIAASPVSEQALAAAALAGEGESADIGACSLLYVEDNLSNLRLIEHIFAGRPEVKLLSAMHGELGLELARSQRPDVILLDLHLPDMPGERVLERLREDPGTQEIPVIVLSADATAGQVTRLRESGASAYLTKPLDVPRFLEALKDTIHAGKGVAR